MQSKFASKTQAKTTEPRAHRPSELQLTRETLQSLQPTELQTVHGGNSQAALGTHQINLDLNP